jgi:Domain of unknown function (DUF4440)
MKMGWLALGLVVIATATPASAQRESNDRQLYDEILRADRAMFEAFNGRNLNALMASFTEDLEFYHDNDGKESFADTKAGFERMFAMPDPPRRELVPGTLRVYPVPRFGAMEIGSHKFCHVERGKEECGVFDFAMVWQKQANGWRVSRVLSFGH